MRWARASPSPARSPNSSRAPRPTEDAFERPFGLFYRFLPNKPMGGTGSLRAGGALEAMRVPKVPDLSAIQETGASFEAIEWVPVPDSQAKQTPIRLQDFGSKGITHAQKLEGCYWGGKSVCFVSSFAHSAEGSAADRFGQVWKYEPYRRRLTLVIVFGPSTDIQLPGESPDNICLAPSGGLMVCDDAIEPPRAGPTGVTQSERADLLLTSKSAHRGPTGPYSMTSSTAMLPRVALE